jgi:hypothetical protein
MAPLKRLVAASTVLLVVLVLEPYSSNTADPQRVPSIPIHIQRGNQVEEHYNVYTKRLQGYFESLSAVLRAKAPDLLPLLEPPKPLQHGYQILPKITFAALPAEAPSHARSAWYSWPWTDELIDRALMEILHSAAELNRATTFSLLNRTRVYEKLAGSYRQIRERQQNIDAHIQYNRLWQAAIASDRAGYDRQTILYNEVLEHQALLDALKPAAASAWNRRLSGISRIDVRQNLTEMEISLRQREQLLARAIHAATRRNSTPAFVRVEHRAPGLWVLHVPFFTDIDDQDYVESLKETIEKIWRLRDGDDEFHVELAISYIPAAQLYAESQPPKKGDKINAHGHVTLFPRDGAILTTGALTTHVSDRAIILGPHDIAPRVLAHEFGHILGFRDSYIRGYKDLGKNGFQVMEVVAEPNDIMGAPATGPVLRSHFQMILERFTDGKSARLSSQ